MQASGLFNWTHDLLKWLRLLITPKYWQQQMLEQIKLVIMKEYFSDLVHSSLIVIDIFQITEYNFCIILHIIEYIMLHTSLSWVNL